MLSASASACAFIKILFSACALQGHNSYEDSDSDDDALLVPEERTAAEWEAHFASCAATATQ